MRTLKSWLCHSFGKASESHRRTSAIRPQRMRLAFIGACLLALGSCLLLADALELHVTTTSGNNLLQSITLPVRKAANALTALAPAPVPSPTPTFTRVGERKNWEFPKKGSVWLCPPIFQRALVASLAGPRSMDWA